MQLHRFKIPKPNPAFWATFLIAIFSNLGVANASAASDPNLACTDVKFVFARGSGAEVGSARDYTPFKNAVDNVFASKSHSIYELGSKPGGYSGRSYPAPGIGIATWERFDTSLGALFSGGASGTYGDSVEEGSDEAMSFILAYHAKCPNSKIVLAGYSQGAQVVSRTLQKVKPAWVSAALTFGDPKLYLPEGKRTLSTSFGLSTRACTLGASAYSAYRAYVPDCYAYQGILGGYQPYHPVGYDGKVFAYCQFHDVICSSYVDPGNLAYGHATYDAQGTYLRAAGEVYDFLFDEDLYPAVASHNLVIFLDNSLEAAEHLPAMQNYALRLARAAFKKNGKVAVVIYADPYSSTPLVPICTFDTCTAANISDVVSGVSAFEVSTNRFAQGISTTLHTLRWEAGAQKSYVLLSPRIFASKSAERDEIVERSLAIDPVNFYALTTDASASSYLDLASRTNGAVFSLGDTNGYEDLESAIFAHIEPTDFSYGQSVRQNPQIQSLVYEKTSASSLKISVSASNATYFTVSINDYIFGYTDQSELEITDLDLTVPQTVCLAPISSDGFRSSPVCTTVPGGEAPKAPNSGQL